MSSDQISVSSLSISPIFQIEDSVFFPLYLKGGSNRMPVKKKKILLEDNWLAHGVQGNLCIVI